MNIFKWLQNKEKKGNCKHSSLKMEADFSADPLWCSECGYNLDIDDFSISDELKKELINWVLAYKQVSMEEHNKIGGLLAERVKEELGKDFHVTFIEQ